MNCKTRLAVALALACGVSLAQATTYGVSAVFADGGVQGKTFFNGSFDWNGTTVSNFQGLLSGSMWAWNTATNTFNTAFDGTGMSNMPAQYLDQANNCTSSGCTGYAQNESPWYDLSHQLVSSVAGNYVTVTTFKNNSTDVVAGGGYDVWGTDMDTDPNNAMAFGFSKNANRNNNAFFTLVFDKNDPANTTMTWDQIVYGDMTRFGMMPMVTGWTGMTGHINHGAGAGSMDGYPTSLAITAAVPEPETYAMMMAGLGLVGFMSRRRKARGLAQVLAA